MADSTRPGHRVARWVEVVSLMFVQTAVALNVFAGYAGSGEVVGRVTESHREGAVTVFSLDIKMKKIMGPELTNPNPFVYSGPMMDEIKPGQSLHLWFQGGGNGDYWYEHCGLFVARLKLPSGRTLTGNLDVEREKRHTAPLPDESD